MIHRQHSLVSPPPSSRLHDFSTTRTDALRTHLIIYLEPVSSSPLHATYRYYRPRRPQSHLRLSFNMNPPLRPLLAARAQTQGASMVQQDRNNSSSSDSSSSSQVTAVSTPRPPTYNLPERSVASTISLVSSSRAPPRPAHDLPLRQQPSGAQLSSMHQRHRSRQYSQGFFEPTMSKTSITASIAAQAAMHIQTKHHRRRSQNSTDSRAPKEHHILRSKPSYPAPIQTSQHSASSLNVSQSRDVANTGRHISAISATTVYPRSPLASPDSPDDSRAMSPVSPMEPKPSKEKSLKTLFSKPKTTYKEIEKKVQISPSKSTKSATFPRMMNYSTTSLVSPSMSAAPSIYSSVNTSTSTLVPSDRAAVLEKDKHKHNFLSRQKLKLKEGSDHHHLVLSSASSNSRPTDPNAPQSLYSFAPSSPAPGSAFNKSISGLDLRHGGRALREKKREEKATASGFVPTMPSSSLASDSVLRDRDHSNLDWLGPSSVPNFGPPSASSTFFPASDIGFPTQGLSGLGLPGMTQDDAWPLLKARLLNIFEGEDLRTPIEDFNRLVTAHLQRCIQRRAPGVIVEDLRDLLHTGFTSLDITLRQVPDDRLVPHLVGIWSFVFNTILPFMQAVFLPLEHEFKARSNSLGVRDLADFWGITLNQSKTPTSAGKSPATPKSPLQLAIPLEALSVRALVLLMFRDILVFPRHETLLTIFSHLSLESINFDTTVDHRHYSSLPHRPGTSASFTSGGPSSIDPASVTSQGSTILDSSLASGSLGARSRATSNTSASSFQSMSSSAAARQRQQPQSSRPHVQSSQGYRPTIDSAKVTQTAARMLQCVSVLAGLPGPGYVPGGAKTGLHVHPDEADAEVMARKKMEQLAKELKLNWLGRGRMGRNRMGFVGGKNRTPIAMSLGAGVGIVV